MTELSKLVAATGLSFVLFSSPLSSVLRAQTASGSDAQESQLDFWPVRGGIYMLVGHGGNVTASVGPDGVLLVDTGTESSSEVVMTALQRLEEKVAYELRRHFASDGRVGAEAQPNPGPVAGPFARSVRYVINSGPQPEHVGGNATLMKASVPADFSLIAHENVLLHLVAAEEFFDMLPTHTIGTGEFNLTGGFNGESVRLTHVAAASTDGDVLVYFRGSDVISTGDVFSMDSFPVIDIERGGSIDGSIRALDYILALAIPGPDLDGGTLIVPGHGRLADAADVGHYRDMLSIIRDRIQHSIDSGMTLEEIQGQRPTLGYEGRFGANSGPWTTEMFVGAVYRSLMEERR